MKAFNSDGEVEMRALRLRPPQMIGWDLDIAQRVFLDSHSWTGLFLHHLIESSSVAGDMALWCSLQLVKRCGRLGAFPLRNPPYKRWSAAAGGIAKIDARSNLAPRQPGGAKPWVRTADAANIAMWPLKSERA